MILSVRAMIPKRPTGMSTDLSVFMEGGRASGSAPEQVGIITCFGWYLFADWRYWDSGILTQPPGGLVLGGTSWTCYTGQPHGAELLSFHEFLTVGRDGRARTGRTVKDGVRYDTLSMLTPLCWGGMKAFFCHAVNGVGTTA